MGELAKANSTSERSDLGVALVNPLTYHLVGAELAAQAVGGASVGGKCSIPMESLILAQDER